MKGARESRMGLARPAAPGALALALLAFASGCTSVASSAVRTGPVEMPPYAGPVAVFAAGQPASGTPLGIVEVHASGMEGTLENLVPLFVKRVAQLGGNAAVIDSVRARFEVVAHPYTETYTYPCGLGLVCVGTEVHAVDEEVMVVTVRGRAWSIPGGAR